MNDAAVLEARADRVAVAVGRVELLLGELEGLGEDHLDVAPLPLGEEIVR